MINPPTWLYKQISVPNLLAIQQELLLVSKQEIHDIDGLQPNFHYIPRIQIQHPMPCTHEYLARLGILERWKYLALITGNQGTSLPLHVDTLDWTTRNYGLNIPVLNCAGSWTVFYQAKIDRPTQEDPADPRASAWYCQQDTAIEIDRVESVNPCWVNICIPHRPEVTHDRPRILASFRFDPELHDILND